MTRIEPTGTPSAPAETPASEEAPSAGTSEEFEHVIAQKAEGEPTSKKSSPETDRRTSDAPDTAHGTDAGVTRRQGTRDSDAGGSEGRSGRRETSSPETSPARRVPGDVVLSPILPAATPEAQTSPVRSLSPEAAALIQQIVERIVDAVQVRMSAGGATEVRMELHMGRLGPVTVELHRTPEGQVRVDFQAVTAGAQRLLTDHLSELTQRLEARGLALQEVTVRTPDQPEFQWTPPAQTSHPALQGDADRGRRDRPSPEETPEETER